MTKIRKSLPTAASVLALAAFLPSAWAGGYAVREQSAEFQGMSFAGNATSGGGISSMYWNPATSAFNAPRGLTVEGHGALVLPDSSINGSVFAGNANLGLPASSGQIGKEAIVPSTYTTYRFSDQLVLGFNAGAPFGFRTGPDNAFWAGQTFAGTSKIKTMNYQASAAYKLAPWISVGAGFQIQTINAVLESRTGVTPTAGVLAIEGTDSAYGWSAGIDLKPFAGTSIGLGYRSHVQHTLRGGISVPGTTAPVVANTTTPDAATLSLRQAIAPSLAVLASLEWSGWSSLKSLDVVCTPPSAFFCPAGQRSLALGWHDGWFYSAGLEYNVNRSLTVRAGGAYEKSPIQNPAERSLRVPDSDRIWASLGATYAINRSISMDLAYTHIWVDEGAIDRRENNLRFVGKSDSSLDILSASFKWQLGPHADAAPLK